MVSAEKEEEENGLKKEMTGTVRCGVERDRVSSLIYLVSLMLPNAELLPYL